MICISTGANRAQGRGDLGRALRHVGGLRHRERARLATMSRAEWTPLVFGADKPTSAV
jgi:hypothetical protein